MNEQLEKKLAQDLRKSGFYSEMMAIHACEQAKWECRGSFTYVDKDVRSTRECDFEAVKEWRRRPHDKARVIARIIGQVKKSETPWIVFIDRQGGLSRFRDGWDNVIPISTAAHRQALGKELFRHSLAARNGWIGSAIHEAFKKPTESSRWHSAFVTACKAAESAFDVAATTAHRAVRFELIRPVVVLDGLLITAELSPAGNLVLTETKSAPFIFEYRSDAYARPYYYLDVVTLDGFPRYLEHIEARMFAVIDVLPRRGGSK